MKEDLIEKMYLGIPYNSEGFKNWLVTSRILSEDEATKQVELIRESDIELWQPGEPELFRLLGEWLEEAGKANSKILRSLYLDVSFSFLVNHIREVKELKETVRKENKKFLSDVITSFELYETFLRATLNYYEFDPDLYKDDDPEEKTKRYPKIPLDDEFNRYLKDSKYTDSVRYKMVSNLRKLNALVINNGRGDSDWLQKIVDKAKTGTNIRYTRLIANHSIHAAIENIDGTEGLTEDMLRGGLSTINHYLDFLIRTYLTKKKIITMNTESNKVLLLGIGGTGLEVAQIIHRNEVKVMAICAFEDAAGLKPLSTNSIGDEDVIIIVAELGNEKENSLAIQTSVLAKEQGKIVIAILTIPRLIEGEKTIMRALKTAKEIEKSVDSLLVINKETFNTLPENGSSFTDLINYLVTEEKTIADSVQNILNLITPAPIYNIDLDDLKTTLVQSGTFTIGRGIGAGENRIGLAIEDALSSPMMRTCDIFTSRKALIKVLTPKKSPITVEEMRIISEFIGKFSSHADMKWGMAESDDDDTVSVIILVSGFDVKFNPKIDKSC